MHVGLKNSNHTFPGYFILLGLSNILVFQVVFFLLLLMLYVVTLSGNVLLVCMVRLNSRLQTPMYFFLSNLSTIDICFSSAVVPKILANTIYRDGRISFLGCATQLYFHLALGGTECLILAAMAFDRYNAICKPLQYNMIMNHNLCLCLAAGSWILNFTLAVVLTMVTFDLPFCKDNRINHFFCEMPPMLHLSCGDIWFSVVVECTLVVIIVAGSFLLILITYFFITLTILNLKSNIQRQKAFSTCASHLLVVLLFYGTALFMHLRPPSSYFPEQDKVVSVFYSVVTPAMNPIIYSIRNTEIKAAIKKSMAVVVCHRSGNTRDAPIQVQVPIHL